MAIARRRSSLRLLANVTRRSIIGSSRTGLQEGMGRMENARSKITDIESLRRLQDSSRAKPEPVKAIGGCLDESPAVRRLRERVASGENNDDGERRKQHEAGKLVRYLRAELGNRYSPERVRLSEFAIYHTAQKSAVAKLIVFIENLTAGCGSLILYGAVGTGKDHLMANALYAAARRGIEAGWVNGQELYGQARDLMGKPATNESAWLNTWSAPQILGISDPVTPVGELSAWRLELLYRLIDRRYRAMKKTWVTMNVKTEEEADQKLSQQVFDRLQEGATIIPCFWPSFREKKKMGMTHGTGKKEERRHGN